MSNNEPEDILSYDQMYLFCMVTGMADTHSKTNTGTYLAEMAERTGNSTQRENRREKLKSNQWAEI